MIKIKNTSLIILLSFFNHNLNSMQTGDIKESENFQQDSDLLRLPEEMIQSIIKEIIRNKIVNYIEKIKNISNIFQLYSAEIEQIKKNKMEQIKKELIAELLYLSSTSRKLRCNVLDFIESAINQIKKAITEKKEELINKIIFEYQNQNKSNLNCMLQNILNQCINNRHNLEEATKLIIAGANVNLKSNNGNAILIRATYHGHKDIVELLLNHKDINVNIQNDLLGQTALIKASYYGYKDIVELLLNHKDINVNIQDNIGYTALMWAMVKNYQDIVKLLLNNKNVNF